MNEFLKKRLLFNDFPNQALRTAYEFLADRPNFFIKSLYEYKHIELFSDIEILFKRVMKNGIVPDEMLSPGADPWEKTTQCEETCYWIVIEPFRFFLDIDCENFNVTINDIVLKVKTFVDHFLICEHEPWVRCLKNKMQRKKERVSPSVKYDQYDRKSYTIFTDRMVTYQEAEEIEYSLSCEFGKGFQKYINFFNGKTFSFPKSPIDCVFSRSSPFSYRRAPYSLSYLWHSKLRPFGGFRARKSIPKLELSNLPLNVKSPIDYFKFSYPNKTTDYLV